MACKIKDLTKMKLLYNLSRGISTSDTKFAKSYAAREGKFFSKIMKGERTPRTWSQGGNNNSSNPQTLLKPRVPYQNKRRNDVLNKLFMKHITDLLTTGEVTPDIVVQGVEISRVSVTPDFNKVNVFWYAKDGAESDELTEQTLHRAEGPLRHELSQLRVMGVVPMIKFVKDRQYIKIIEVDQRLKVADFGEGFVPTDPAQRLKTIPVLDVELPSKVWSEIEKLEENTQEIEEQFTEDPLPAMRNDVLGLDQALIMAKVKGSLDKSRVAFNNRCLNIPNPVSEEVQESSKVTEYLSVKQKNAAFSAFLSKRQIDEKIRKKIKKSRNLNREEELSFFDKPRIVDDDDDFLDDNEQELNHSDEFYDNKHT
ncbi:uncharacterized protein LOC124410140 [Diprion similis]|uniref:uncharacterized protein LOC124410140 n=1 Tax=Diprion similis TaxID=362088 RepID=UPI001EF84EC3|nr:uncharacterized protein LOC124410140 [Diprion similis]